MGLAGEAKCKNIIQVYLEYAQIETSWCLETQFFQREKKMFNVLLDHQL